MASNYGNGVSRVMDPTAKQMVGVVWQQNKPPLDSELNLLQDLATDWRRKIVLSGCPSGWLGNETNLPSDFVTDTNWSNYFKFGRQRDNEKSPMWAVVNGWLIPVMSTKTGTPPGSPNDTDTSNVINLDPPPSNSGDFRTDFAFLEVWLARVAPNPSVVNKPSAASIWPYGNVESGLSYIQDDIQDSALGFETTQRVQLQYRIRVVKGLVGLATNPDGFDTTAVKAQGAATTETAFTFTNMRSELGDAGLWRAGDGTANALATVDGYVYAIPLCAVFRRNAIVWAGDPAPNLNGAFNRNPTAVDRTGTKTFTTLPTLSSSMTAAATTLSLISSTNVPLPATPAAPVLIQIGDEYMTYSSISGSNLNGLVRGLNGTRAEVHPIGAVVRVVSSRPDGLFADQVAATDILDLRHAVNPNGFNYESLLRSNLDKLLRGKLRANWKRGGNGSQGGFVFYQDKLTSSSAALGVNKIDAPDNIRQVFSDAPSIQSVEYVLKPTGASIPASINANWSLSVTATQTLRTTPSQFSANDVITFPVSALKGGVSGGDADQIRWVNDGILNAVTLRIDGQNAPIPSDQYTVTPTNPTPTNDLVITFASTFPGTTKQIYVTLHAMYGGGRGLSRRPDSLHSVAYLQPSTDLLLTPSGVPSTNYGVKVARAPLWSKYRSSPYKGNLPVTAEAYADLGSKTLILTPFRRITWPTEFRTMDGTAANVSTTNPVVTSNTGSTAGSTTFTDLSANYTTAGVTAGMALVLLNGLQPGRYTVVSVPSSTTITVDRSIPTGSSLSYTVSAAQGLMPTLKPDGTAKWTTTDPLGLFSCSTDTTSTGFANTKNIYVTLPRKMVPGFGEVYAPILTQDNSVFCEGVNFMVLSKKDGTPPSSERNFVPYNNGALSYAAFSTVAFGPPEVPATYNTAFTYGGVTYAGVRQFTDGRGLNRQGLELPPFYGVSRLFAVYEAEDYKTNGSAYFPSNRTARGSGATNLLRQNLSGPTFWIETDVDGDSTFILNADALDISRSPNPIGTFASGNYVIEASIFGFDRGSFNLDGEFRMVLTRPTSASLMRSEAADISVRANNLGVVISGPVSVLPGPATATDSVVVNYSRTPYQGDAWGSQTSYADIGYAGGAIQSAVAYQVVGSGLNAAALSRPNEKALEVLSSVSFATTLGTGRLSGDVVGTSAADIRNVGYEDSNSYPPVTGGATRPPLRLGALTTAQDIGTNYLGATERLPLGSLFRDKDFHGDSMLLNSGNIAPLVFFQEEGMALAWSTLNANNPEYSEVALDSTSVASGTPGDIVVHVDGETGNYSQLTNFRTLRGGSLYTVSGSSPGGEVGTVLPAVRTATAGSTNVLFGRAFLVRNAVTSIGSTEVSAGGELMLLVLTTVRQLKDTSSHSGAVVIGTNGTNEGYSAADLYRIEGHPLTRDHEKLDIDTSSIKLSGRGVTGSYVIVL